MSGRTSHAPIVFRVGQDVSVAPDESVLPDDELAARLRTLELGLRAQLQGVAAVERSQIAPWLTVSIVPTKPDSLPISWEEGRPGHLVFQAGHNGGRWELERDEIGTSFIEAAVSAVIAGRVTETFAPGRSSVRITLRDGTWQQETGYGGSLSSLVLMPGWSGGVDQSPTCPTDS